MEEEEEEEEVEEEEEEEEQEDEEEEEEEREEGHVGKGTIARLHDIIVQCHSIPSFHSTPFHSIILFPLHSIPFLAVA